MLGRTEESTLQYGTDMSTVCLLSSDWQVRPTTLSLLYYLPSQIAKSHLVIESNTVHIERDVTWYIMLSQSYHPPPSPVCIKLPPLNREFTADVDDALGALTDAYDHASGVRLVEKYYNRFCLSFYASQQLVEDIRDVLGRVLIPICPRWPAKTRSLGPT